MTVGFSRSGKSTLVKAITQKYPKRFFVIDTNSIHDFLNKNEIFQDDMSIKGEAFELRKSMTDKIQRLMVSEMIIKGYSIISDSCSQVRNERRERINQIKEINKDMKVAIIHVNTPMEMIMKRATEEDDALRQQGRKPVWEDLIKMQQKRIELPSKDEADYLIEYDGFDSDKVLKELEPILA